MDENFVENHLVHLGCLDYDLSELCTCLFNLAKLRVNNENKCTAVFECCLVVRVLRVENSLARKVFYVELDIRVVSYSDKVDTACGWQKESFMR